MFSGPVRGGTRGGQGDFKWSDVADDKDRENYLGHSILAPVGRWQKNKDITWYNKEAQAIDEDERQRAKREEIQRIKVAEEDALSIALGFKPAPRDPMTRAPETSSNAVPLGTARGAQEQEPGSSEEDEKRKKGKRKSWLARPTGQPSEKEDWKRRSLRRTPPPSPPNIPIQTCHGVQGPTGLITITMMILHATDTTLITGIVAIL